MVCQQKKYIEKIKETYIRLFNTEPSKGLKTPLEKKDHPELDTSDILEGQQVNHFLAMVGQLQRLITLGRFDIQAQVISMSKFMFLRLLTGFWYLCLAYTKNSCIQGPVKYQV